MKTQKDERSRSVAFIALLIEDVIASRTRLGVSHSQVARRDVVRASLAAIEGLTWVAREHVRTALVELDHLTPIADLALREVSYAVSESGQIAEQPRVMPLLTVVRLIVSQARVVSPDISVEFSGTGWSDLRQAVSIRNRITHPKPEQDLTISDNDLAVVESGMFWLLATTEYVMATMNLAFAQHNALLREIVDRLKAGDPDALAEYHAILQEIQAKD